MRSRALLPVLVLLGCSSESEPPTTALARPLAAAPSTAGAESCLPCHRSHTEDWSRTGMARAMGPLEQGELEGLPAVTDGAGFRFEFADLPPHGVVLTETHAEQSGHALASPVRFAIGAGVLDRSYVVSHGQGMRFAPVEVLSVPGGRRPALAPHAAMLPGSRLTQPITAECLGCHSDALPPADYPLDTLPLDWTPRGIGCAACHGEAEAHAAWQHADEQGQATGEDPLVTLGTLSREQRMSVCAACHLQGDARLVLDREALGPPPPGGDLLEQRALFVAREPGDEVGFVSQVERLVLSRCYLESAMTCETCHDPHQTLRDSKVRQEVRARCLDCHAPDPGSAPLLGASPTASRCSRGADTTIETHSVQLGPGVREDCVDCHMPPGGVFDVAEVSIHDHFIRRAPSPRPPSTDEELRYPEAPDGDWRLFTWPGQPAPVHAEDPGLWMMALAGAGHRERALREAGRAPGPDAERLPMYHHVRGSLLEGAGRGEEALSSYLEAIERSGGLITPASAPAATNAGRLLGQLGRAEEGLQLLSKLLARYPDADAALRNRAFLLARLGRAGEARADLTRAFRLRPEATTARGLATLERALGNAAAAERWDQEVRVLEPLGAD